MRRHARSARPSELKDEKLYGQGLERSEFDFCSICLLAIPFPIDDNCSFKNCCLKLVCNGCIDAMHKRGLHGSCPFCRSPAAGNDEVSLGRIQKRVAARDPQGLYYLGCAYFHGQYGLEQNQSRAFELWNEAAEIGSKKALCKVGFAYYDGNRGLSHDKAKGIRCLELAATQGCVESRTKLGLVEYDNGNHDRALRHFMISAKMGEKVFT
ncbi:hypothetical protein THAOC_26138 [Thalassiosira oceanica]|uniref:RING-type domain-containing protein n=1 Tax=Thalassiosira oceanica TaxID=159749 RepID=K0RZR7_THAOC|nr:hypothetical protein THAOC_26138 [Thalassiosira oceanica]|eukprot:EJK54256.1 hypothetical protein THAOC_26138 [Thalassiosira oceanica]